jgi:glyoxylase-like metal-dependent hydrolase (beta-lactamase superfamily II)
MEIPFVSEAPPTPGKAVSVARGILRVTAPNSGPLTYHGTNSYIVQTTNGCVIIDPGPNELSHIKALLRTVSSDVAAVLITHGHEDHTAAATSIQAETGAWVYGFENSIAEGLRIDAPLTHGDVVHGLRVLHTPGHSPDHLCFATPDGVLFSGDHVMTWSTSAVSPPRGKMADYRRSLSLLLDGDYRLLLPGHGAPSHTPTELISALLANRIAREQQVLSCVKAGATSPHAIANLIYRNLASERRGPAERTIGAYLISLAEAGSIHWTNGKWVPLAMSVAPGS